MRLQDNIDYTTLGWVKPELDETLRQARIALEGFVESPGDSAAMRECAGFLHQVQGTLRMVELYGAAMVAEEMEHLARAAVVGGLRDPEEAYSVLMRGIVQLPDYLERLQSGHKDIPIVLLPLLNSLRAARGENAVNESLLFSPDLGRPLPASALGPLRSLPDETLRQQAEGLRAQYQAALLNWLKDDNNPATISALASVCERLVPLLQVEAGRRLFWVAAGTLGALQAGAFEASKPLKQALARVEREIKRLVENGERVFREDPPLELTRQLLYFVAHAPTEHDRIGELRQVFGLDRYVPSQSEVSHAQGSMAGHNRALLDTVAGAIKEDLLRVKDALDLHLRNPAAAPEELSPQVEVLDRVGDTLGMLGLGVPRRVVQEQRDAVAAVSGRQRPADESTLLDIAGALLYVEASLDDQVMRLGQQEEAPAPRPDEPAPLPSADAQKLLETLAKEAIANFAQARQCFIAYVETSWDAAQLEDVPRLLEEVSGVLRMLELPEPADYLEAVRRFTSAELLQHRRVPNARQLDTLADALASIEYYLEALRDHRGQRERILDIARESLASLGYWPLPEAGAALPDHPADRAPVGAAEFAPVPAAGPADAPATAEAPTPPVAPEPPRVEIPTQLPPEIEAAIAAAAADTGDALFEEKAAPVIALTPEPPDAPATAVPVAPTPTLVHGAGGFEGGSDDIDDEIREVFLEEFSEEIENLGQLLPAWRANRENLELLRPIRRVFHTLKGSGRLVGALTLGEFSWKVENMLNRVLDGSRPASQGVVALVEAAHGRLPELHRALQGQGGVPADIEDIKALADRLAAGEEVMPVAGGPAAAAETPVATQTPVATKTPFAVEAGAEAPAAEAEEVVSTPGAIAEEAVERAASASPAPEAAAEAPVTEDLASPSTALDAGVPVGAVAAAVDSVLLEILKPEVTGHLDTVDAWLGPAGTGPSLPTDALLRAVHTMNGAFAMTEVPRVPELTSPLEGYIKRLIAARARPSRAGLELVRESALTLRHVLECLEAPEPYVPSLGDLPERMLAERDTLPEPSRPTVALSPEPEETTDAGIQVVNLDEPDFAALPDFEGIAGPAEAAEAAGAGADADERAVDALAPADEEQVTEAGEPAAETAALEAIPEVSGAAEAAEPQVEPGLAEAADRIAREVFDATLIETIVPAAAMDIEAATPVALDEEALAAFIEGSEERREPEVEAPGALEDTGAAAPPEEYLVEEASSEAFAQPDVEETFEEIVLAEEADGPTAGEAVSEPEFVLDDIRLVDELPGDSLEIAPPVGPEADSLELGIEEVEFIEATGEEAEAPSEAGATVESVDFDEIAEPADTIEADGIEQAVEAIDLSGFVDAAETEAIPGTVEAEVAEAAPAFVDADPDPAGAMDLEGIDEELLDIFLEEAHDLLDQSDGLLAQLSQSPSERELVVGLQRDLHTLKGGARMAGIHPVGELGHAMETLLEAVTEGRVELDRAGVGLLEHGFDRLHRMVTRVERREALALPVALIAQVEAFSRGEPLPAPAQEIPAEAVEPTQPEVGIEAVEAAEPAETAEAVALVEPVEAAEPEPVAPEVAAQAAAESVEAEQADQTAESAIPTPAFEPGIEAEAPATEFPPSAPAVRTGEGVATRVLKPLSAPLEADALAEEEEPGAIRAPQEQVRIRADLLDRLVNYAGEVAIYRARLEQQLGSFRGNLGELEATTSRLREQLRKLDIETEAQIIARYQREHKEEDATFDPLELDRFSNLQQLSRALAESAADLVSLQEALDEHTRQYETLLLQQSRVSSDLQEGLMRTRMVPFDALVPRLRRVLRQAASETGKQVQIRVEGAQGDMDRNVLERMTAPLEHMLRNAVAHGLESPKDRRTAGKPEEGTVRVSVSREGSEVVIAVADDGRGLDPEAIRRKAIERGLLQAGVEVGEQALYGFIMEPGFSTAETVSRLAGRGVGMDVVHNEIRQLGGSLSIRSERGAGTEFTIRLPFTLAVTQAVFVKIGETSFAVPIASVRGVGRVSRAELEAQLGSESPTYRYAGEDYAIHDLGTLLGHASAKAADSLQMPLLLARSGDLRAAICIDQVLGSREIVVKPVGPQVASIPGIFGATVMGDGSVVVILDVAPLVRRHQALVATQDAKPVEEVVVEEVRRVPLVMVVDDSITMRKVTGRVLERHNFEVMTAKDGVDAIEKMAERVPDVMLLDIEMPRMDGYELATHMRNEARLKDVPIVMITSRTGEKHRQRAFEIGVNRYLGKPYQEAELMRNVFDLLEGKDD